MLQRLKSFYLTAYFVFITCFCHITAVNAAEIHDAIYQKDLARVVYILHRDQDKNIVNLCDPESPIYLAVLKASRYDPADIDQYNLRKIREEIVSVLISHGANLDLGDSNPSLLHLAAAGKNTYLIDILLRAGLDINKQWLGTSLKETPLHIAISCGSDNMVSKLLSQHADVNIPRGDSQTSLMLAIPSFRLCRDTYIIESIIRADRDINARTNRGFTALHTAAFYGDKRVAKLLLYNGAAASIDIQTIDTGETPLHLACSFFGYTHDKIHLIPLLIRCGAKLTIVRDAMGKTPYEYFYDFIERSRRLGETDHIDEFSKGPVGKFILDTVKQEMKSSSLIHFLPFF